MQIANTNNLEYDILLSYIQGSQDVNDYTLINELSFVVRKYMKEKKHVDKKFSKQIYDILSTNYKCSCNKIIGTDYNMNESFYETETDKIYLEYTTFNLEHDFTEDSLQEEYYQAIDTIVHEFTHKMTFVFINYVSTIECEPNLKKALLTFAKLFLYEDDFFTVKTFQDVSIVESFYDEFHDYFFTERIAINRGKYIALEVMKKVYKEEAFNYQMEFINTLLFGYEKSERYPLKTFANLIDSTTINEELKRKLTKYNLFLPEYEETNNYLYERMYLGLHITENEYSKVYDYLMCEIPFSDMPSVFNKKL